MAIELVDFPIKNGGSFHSFLLNYQRVVFPSSARIDMKVCWKYTPAMGESGPMARHVAQAFSGAGQGGDFRAQNEGTVEQCRTYIYIYNRHITYDMCMLCMYTI